MQVGKTNDRTAVRELLERVNKSKNTVLDKIPNLPPKDLKSEAFILNRGIPLQHVFAIRKLS